MQEEKQLITRSQQGDMEAFEQLVIRYEKKMYTIAYKYMGNHEDASDLAQEGLIQAYRSLAGFRHDSSFGTWMGRIVANKCLDALRKGKKYNVTSLDEKVSLGDGDEVAKEIPSNDPSVEEQLERKEQAVFLQKLISQLKPEYRVVVVLRELEGYSYEEIAQQLDCSLGTVKSRLSRARKYLQQQIMAGKES